jgi:hypothetical protein
MAVTPDGIYQDMENIAILNHSLSTKKLGFFEKADF